MRLLTFLLFAITLQLTAQNIPNPVLPGVADAGVIKYNGKYYIGGVFTDGAFYVSDDLVKWDGPVKVFHMDNDWTRGSGAGDDQVHANDMRYLNGTFHLYWSVNYWGKDHHAVHITHAEADDILGPYAEPVTNTWMDNRIDPNIFRDDDGQLYMYMVRFIDGNTICVRPMSDPRTFSGPPVYQFASLPDTWETMDNRVAEGPWVMKYRDRYYMMYNANHTGTPWGNYQLGVAETDSPVTFNHTNKYPYPVVSSNQVKLDEEEDDLLFFNKTYDPVFLYRTTKPTGDWTQLSYQPEGWEKGKVGFSEHFIEGSTTRKQGTVWNTQELWVRKEFYVSRSTGNLALKVQHDGPAKVYLNGTLIYEGNGADYCSINLDKNIRALLKEGNNVLTAETKAGNRRFFDVSLLDMGERLADDIIYCPGQPNILRGLNGFDWWLIYMADKNKERRSQFINRVHFFGKTMYTDGPTGPNTPGYHPNPYSPTYGDHFDTPESLKNWNFTGQEWTVGNGEMTTAGSQQTAAFIKQATPAMEYLIEANVKTDTDAGVYAWYKDNNNWLRVGLNPSNNSWYYTENKNGTEKTQSHPLWANTKGGVYHMLRVERNGTQFTIRIDELAAPGESVIQTSITEKGIPGLYSKNGTASFDGIIYTLGWDEYDRFISGWETTDRFDITQEGLQPTARNFKGFKGDPLDQYEFTTQVSGLKGKGKAGIYPVYVDEKNYIKTLFNNENNTLEVEIVQKGKSNNYSHPLATRNIHYTDCKYTDFIEKAYCFRDPVLLDEITLSRRDVENPDQLEDNMFDKLRLEYLYNGKWNAIDKNAATADPSCLFNTLAFSPVWADALRFINVNPEGRDRHIYKIRVNEVYKESFNIRTVKLKDSFMIFVDGKEIARYPLSLGKARVGIVTEDCQPVYNGILRFDIP